MNIAMLALHSSPLAALGARDAGGMSVVLVELSAALARRGHRVDLFTCRGDSPPGEPVRVGPGVRLVRLGGVPAGVAKAELHDYLPALAAEVCDLVGTNGWSYDRVHSHYWLSAVVGQQVSKQWGIPHLVTFHTLGAVKNRLACGEDESTRRLAAERELAAVCDEVIAPSVREGAFLEECCSTPSEHIAVVPWGVDLGSFCPGDRTAARTGLGVPPDVGLLLFVGRFAPVKGLDLLLRALSLVAARCSEVRLLVAGGDGSESSDTRAGALMAAALGVSDRVTWLGPVPRERMPPLYRAADLLVVPSRYESFGLAALESLACGTPVVATRVGALDRLVVGGVNGRLCEEPEPDALAVSVTEYLSGHPPDPGLVRATVEDWTWDRSAHCMEEVYRKVDAAESRGILRSAP